MKLLTSLLLPVSCLAGFHYGPDVDWSQTHGASQGGECDGSVQSPIDIASNNAKPTTDIDPIQVTNFFKNSVQNKVFKLETDPIDSTKHALKFSFNAFTPLHNEAIKCAQFHFHIDQSEHTLNGQNFLAELHLVCFQSKFENLGAAVASKESNALMVFGSWIQEQSTLTTDNAGIDNVINAYNAEENAENPIMLNEFEVPMPENIHRYYRYDGSLTTPNCNEVVTWTVFTDPILVTPEQANALRNMRSEVIKNNRPTLPLNGREVTLYSAEVDGRVDEPEEQDMTVFYIIVAIAVVLVAVIMFFVLKKKKEPQHTSGREAQELV